MKIYDGCYRLLRLTIAHLADCCLLFDGQTLIGLLPFICRPIIEDSYIRFIIQVPADFKLSSITNIKIKAKTELLFLIDIKNDGLLTRDFGYVLNVKIKLGAH